MKKLIVIILTIFTVISNSIGQDDECSKTIVAVSCEVVKGTRTYEFLENDFGSRDIGEWNGFVTHMLVQILTEFEPEITFSSLEEAGENCHYFFRASLDLGSCRDENYEYTGQTGYYIQAGLTANANCIPNRNWKLDIFNALDPDLKQAMKNMVSQFYPMDRNIVMYEINHPSPPRDPKLNIVFEKEYISPLDKESRKTKVNAKVYDCRERLVCDKNHGQPVYYQDHIDRLDLKQKSLGEGGYHVGNFMVIVTNKDCINEGEYKLEKGVEAEKKKIRFKTCSLGGPIDEFVVEEKELIIRGLAIDVKPDRKAIKKEEQTRIVITFNETDPEGSKYPVKGRDIDVKISGLEDGKITPENGYTTNSEGKVILDYKAGSNDKKITITASYQPVDYPDKVTGSGFVNIIPDDFAWVGIIELELTQTYNCDVTEQTGEYGSKRTMAGDHKKILTDILIGMTDFDLPAVGNSIDGKLQYLSGQVTLNMSENHTTSWDAGRTQCHNNISGRWEWVSPGNWGSRHETWAGQAYRDVNMEEAVLNLLITKKSLSDKSAVDDMQKELAVLQSRLQNAINSKDMKSVEQIKGEMRNLAQGGENSGDIPVKAVIEISFGVKNYPVYTTYERKVYNVCLGEYEENESRAETLEMPILPPFGCQMEGIYIMGQNGNDRIDVSINDTKQVYKEFGSGTCPKATLTVKGSIYLERISK